MKRHNRRKPTQNTSSGQNAFLLTALIVILIIVLGKYIIVPTINFINNNSWIMVLIPSLLVLAIVIFAIYKLINHRYGRFVWEHSVSIRKLVELNKLFTFEEIPNFDMEHSYDNETFYNDISPLDYLTYQLVYQKKDVLNAAFSAEKNKATFINYINNVNKIQEFDRYDTNDIPKFEILRYRHEKRLFNKIVQNPTTELKINVKLKLTNIQGTYKESKSHTFGLDEIKSIIDKLSQKNGDFYLNESAWQSICKVERGKVTNKVRFAVYSRDNNRCRRCGSTHNLEVDHIYPISKGGKSNFDNLQTLCQKCNALKSNKIEPNAVPPRHKRYSNK